jgi:hypothetical protein
MENTMSRLRFIFAGIILVTTGYGNPYIEAAESEKGLLQVQPEGVNVKENVGTVLPGI